MTGDPRDLDAPNWAVRVRAGGGGISYTSARMTKDDAESFANAFAVTVDCATATSREFVIFPGVGFGTTRIRTERVSAIDVVPLQRSSDYENRPVRVEVETR